ncbi:sigma-70 family RNA polymerase sigma factor [Fictibacillus halophilus]|uniref:sigma-70 family RNA polymerase sigma factor n=1 Tax=Fictibacillus halophilus TaxID=1610490 RepID=UPI001CFB5526|nr:sigma-70 family RNA polymerase sigma factor [Fictibacillus halophilus]
MSPKFELTAPYSEVFMQYCLKIAPDTKEAEEIYQEGMLKIHSQILKQSAKTFSRRYLYQMAQSIFIDMKRKENRQNILHPQPMNYDHPEENIFNVESLLNKLLEVLTPQQLAAFILVKEMGLSNKETAAVLRTSEGSVKALLSRGKQNLKKISIESLEQRTNGGLEKKHTLYIHNLSQAIINGEALGIAEAYVDFLKIGFSFVEIERKMGGFSFHFRDPDGHLVKIFSVF